MGIVVERLGMGAVRAHELEITEYAYESLSELDGLTLYGPPPSRRAGVISFSLDGIHPSSAAHVLIADYLVDAINAKYGTALSKLPIPANKDTQCPSTSCP